jgi:hypothetical protein
MANSSILDLIFYRRKEGYEPAREDINCYGSFPHPGGFDPVHHGSNGVISGFFEA